MRHLASLAFLVCSLLVTGPAWFTVPTGNPKNVSEVSLSGPLSAMGAAGRGAARTTCFACDAALPRHSSDAALWLLSLAALRGLARSWRRRVPSEPPRAS